MHEISIRAETLIEIAGWPVTNSVVLSLVALFMLLGAALALQRRLALVPGKFQSIFEMLIEQTLGITDTLFGSRERSERYLPLIVTIFLFILVSNWLGLLPLGAVGVPAPHAGEHGKTALVPLFRAPASDLNFTIALAVISVAATNLVGILAVGIKRHARKFFDFSGPIRAFTGILEFISEFVRIVSFSFRLFGNVFAGEVLLTIIAFLVPYLLPLPFLLLEIFVGFIQAFIFAMLTAVAIAMATATEPAH